MSRKKKEAMKDCERKGREEWREEGGGRGREGEGGQLIEPM